MTMTQQPGTDFERHAFERSLVEAIHEASPDGILVVNEQGVIVSHNRRLFEVLGLPQAELVAGQDGSLSGGLDETLLERAIHLIKEPDAFLARVQALYANPALEDQCELEMLDGRTLERHSKALWGASGRYFGRVWFFRDITARKEVERALASLSRRDPLTGVANRRHFFERATEEFARARRYGGELSLAMLDLDHFKQVNDRWGHAAGDRVLKSFCDGIDPLLRGVDFFARLGGEEFVALLPGTDLQGACLLAERLRRQVERQSMEEKGACIGVTVSAGVASLGQRDTSVESLLNRADRALYAAKHAGRNRTLCQDDLPA